MTPERWMLDPDNLSTNGLLVIYVLFLKCIRARAGRSPRRELEWLMSWYHADWLHGCIPWKKGWGTDEVYRCGAITASPDILHFMSAPHPTHSPHGSVHHPLTHLAGWSGLKAAAPFGVNRDPRVRQNVLFLCLMGNLGVSQHRTLFSREVSMTSVSWHGRFAGRGVTCGARLPLGPCTYLVQVASACTFHLSHVLQISFEDYLLWNAIQA